MKEGTEKKRKRSWAVWRRKGGKEEGRREGEPLVTHQGLQTKKPRTLLPLLPASLHLNKHKFLFSQEESESNAAAA